MEGLSDCFPHSYAEPHVKVGARGRLSQPSGHRAWPPTCHPALETTPDFLSSEPLFTKTDVRARGADVSRGAARARGRGHQGGSPHHDPGKQQTESPGGWPAHPASQRLCCRCPCPHAVQPLRVPGDGERGPGKALAADLTAAAGGAGRGVGLGPPGPASRLSLRTSVSPVREAGAQPAIRLLLAGGAMNMP